MENKNNVARNGVPESVPNGNPITPRRTFVHIDAGGDFGRFATFDTRPKVVRQMTAAKPDEVILRFCPATLDATDVAYCLTAFQVAENIINEADAQGAVQIILDFSEVDPRNEMQAAAVRHNLAYLFEHFSAFRPIVFSPGVTVDQMHNAFLAATMSADESGRAE